MNISYSLLTVYSLRMYSVSNINHTWNLTYYKTYIHQLNFFPEKAIFCRFCKVIDKAAYKWLNIGYAFTPGKMLLNHLHCIKRWKKSVCVESTIKTSCRGIHSIYKWGMYGEAQKSLVTSRGELGSASAALPGNSARPLKITVKPQKDL